MSESEGREIDPISGYPKIEESSPSQGAEESGVTPDSGEAAPSQSESQHEPSPGSPRWNEVYRNWKDSQRELEELRSKYEGLHTAFDEPQTQPQQPQAQSGHDADDPMEEFYRGIEERLERKLQPLMQRFEQQEKVQTIQKQVQGLKGNHPEYEPSRDDALIAANIKRYGIRDLEAAYRLTFPERVVQAQAQQQQQAATRAPVADAPGTSPNAPARSAEELMREFQTTNDPRRREEIASIIADAGGWGAKRAEKALGF